MKEKPGIKLQNQSKFLPYIAQPNNFTVRLAAWTAGQITPPPGAASDHSPQPPLHHRRVNQACARDQTNFARTFVPTSRNLTSLSNSANLVA
jgi:hypothetical protein